MRRYRVIEMDPPWPSEGYSSDGYYSTDDRRRATTRNTRVGVRRHSYDLMPIDAIMALPVPLMLARDAHVFIWTINRFLPDAFDLLRAWGLRYAFTMAWHKNHGPKPPGFPAYNLEHVVVGVKGSPRLSDRQGLRFRLANRWERSRVPSQKPEAFYTMLRRVTQGPRLAMFARREIEGFDVWGHEAPGSISIG